MRKRPIEKWRKALEVLAQEFALETERLITKTDLRDPIYAVLQRQGYQWNTTTRQWERRPLPLYLRQYQRQDVMS